MYALAPGEVLPGGLHGSIPCPGRSERTPERVMSESEKSLSVGGRGGILYPSTKGSVSLEREKKDCTTQNTCQD